MAFQAEIHEMVYSEDVDQRRRAVTFLKEEFVQQEDKETAWQDLIRLAQDEDNDLRWRAAEALGAVFRRVPDKAHKWEDLIRLALDGKCDAQGQTAYHLMLSMLSAFFQVTDKNHAWEDLIRLALEGNCNVRWWASGSLGAVFNQVPDKDKALRDLHRLAEDGDSDVRWRAAYTLLSLFNQVPDRDKAWKDLHRLSQYEISEVRWKAAGILGEVFSQIPERNKAWEDLHRLALDKDCYVRENAAVALGMVFNQVPDRDKAWEDLHRLTLDDDSDVRCTSYNSMGRISILKATESEIKFRAHLEEAIEFFSMSSDEAKHINPAAFCLPFYRSLHSLLFSEVPIKEEVQRYIAEAEDAIGDSESKEVLLEAVINLSKALQEVRTYSIDDILLRKRDLKSYMRYCLQTAECLRETRDKAPLASKIIEKSIPIIDQKIKAAFRDVEAVAGRLCKSTKGTDLEAFGRDAYESTKGLNKVESCIAADQYLERIVPLLKRHCSRLPKEAQEHLKTLVDSQDIASLEQRLNTLESVLLASLVQGENDDRKVIELRGLLDLHLQGIEFAIFNMKDSSGNARKELYSLKNQIDGLQREIESQGLGNKELSESLEERDSAMIDRLNKMREDMIKAVRDTARLNASKRDLEAILKEIDNQDRLKKRDVLGIITDVFSLAEMVLKILL